jgi:hypothetical protein
MRITMHIGVVVLVGAGSPLNRAAAAPRPSPAQRLTNG